MRFTFYFVILSIITASCIMLYGLMEEDYSYALIGQIFTIVVGAVYLFQELKDVEQIRQQTRRKKK